MKRRNNEINVTAIILAVVGLIIVIGVSLWLINTYRATKSSGNNVVSQVTGLFSQYSDEAVAKYDGTIIGGSDLIDLIDEYNTNPDLQGRVNVIVATKANQQASPATSTTYCGAANTAYTLTAVSNANNANYINPQGVFVGKVHLNSNNMVDQITFTQQ